MLSKMFGSQPPTPATVLARGLIQENANMCTALEPALDAIAGELYQQVANTPLLEWSRSYRSTYDSSSSSAGPFVSNVTDKASIYIEMDITKRLLDAIDTTLHLGTQAIRVLEDARVILRKVLLRYFSVTSEFRFSLVEYTVQEGIDLQCEREQKETKSPESIRQETERSYGVGAKRVIMRVALTVM